MYHIQVRFSNIVPKIIGAIFICGLLLYVHQAREQKSVSADVDFFEVFRDNGNFFVASGGVGTRGVPLTGDWTGEGDITLDIPDTATIVLARMIWTGRSNAFDADGVAFARDGVPLGTFTADFQFEQDPWCCGGAAQLHESAVITNEILPGSHTYTISDHEHGVSPNTNNLNYGVGIWVVYEYNDPALPADLERETIVYQGQDSFFRSWAPPRGPHTEVRCATFPPSPRQRSADITHLVSGIDTWDSTNNVDRLRSVAVWSETGTGTPPPADEVDFTSGNDIPSLGLRQPDAIGYDPSGVYPLQSYAQLEWDNFNMPELIIPANDEWLCFQIESGDRFDLAGLGGAGLDASGMWNLFALSIFDPTLSVDLVDFEATAVSPTNVQISWETASETDNFGFNLYRGETNDFDAAELVHFEPASTTSGADGAEYVVNNTVPSVGYYYYWLEDIDTSNGAKTLHGPVLVHVSLFSNEYLPLIQTSP